MSLPAPPLGFDIDASKASSVHAATIILLVIGTLGVALRFYARRKAGVAFWFDDWLVFFAWIIFVMICGANFLGVKYGAGRHMLWVLQYGYPTQMEDFLKYIYGVEILYPFVIGPIKVSICCLYMRIFGVYRTYRYYFWTLIVLSVLWAFSTLMGTILQCHPVQDAWNPLGDRSNCLNIRTFLIGTNVPNVVLDAMILTAPIYPIWQLHLPLRKKFLVLLVLLLGASETAFSVVRLVKLVTFGTTDLTMDYVTPIIWSTVEPSIGLLSACAPVMGVLLPTSWMHNLSTGRRPNNGYSSQKKSGVLALRDLGRKSRSTFDKWGGTSTLNATRLDDEAIDEDGSSQNGIRQTRTVEVRGDAW